MNRIKLPRCEIEDAGENITIRHNLTGVKIPIPKTRLDSWCVGKLRELLSSPAVPATAEQGKPQK